MKKVVKVTVCRLANGFYALLLLLMISSTGFTQNVAINTTLNPANPSAGLDVDFANKGFLIPRVSLTGSGNFAPLPAHIAGMMVYNIATAGDVTPGLYLNDGSKWVAFVPPTGSATGDMQYWSGTAWVTIPAGQPGQMLQLTSTGVPAWNTNGLSSLTTVTPGQITSGTASSGGSITSDGGNAVTAYGVCWNNTSGPTIANAHTTDGAGLGSFTSSITGLSPATTYYVRAYATNAVGTSYGNELTFVTP